MNNIQIIEDHNITLKNITLIRIAIDCINKVMCVRDESLINLKLKNSLALEELRNFNQRKYNEFDDALWEKVNSTRN